MYWHNLQVLLVAGVDGGFCSIIYIAVVMPKASIYVCVLAATACVVK